MSESEKKGFIETTENNLYQSKKPPSLRRRARLRDHVVDISSNWEDAQKTFSEKASSMQSSMKKPSFFKKLFLFSGIFLLGALIFAVYTFLGGGNSVSTGNIDLVVGGKTFVDGGEEFELQLELTNRNTAPLSFAELIIEYAEGSTELGDTPVRIRRPLERIPAGGSVLETQTMRLFGEEGSQRSIRVALEYRIEGSNAIFVKEVPYMVTLRSSPIQLSVNLPELVIPNQEVPATITLRSNATTVLQDIVLQVEYPQDVTLVRSEPEIEQGNVWNIGDISPGQSKEISLVLLANAVPGQEKILRVRVGTKASSQNEIFAAILNSSLTPFFLQSAFLDTTITVMGQSSGVVPLSNAGRISGSIAWRNTLGASIQDASIRLRIQDDQNVITLPSVTGGFFDSNSMTLVWDKTRDSSLGNVSANQSGTLNFSFELNSLVESGNTVVQNPEILFSVDVQGIDTSQGALVRDLTNVSSLSSRVNTNIALATKTLYHSGPFQNTGAMPPRVGQKTTYTLQWLISNTANQTRETEVRAKLPLYVNWEGTTNPSDGTITYNTPTREVIWKPDVVSLGTGFSEPVRTMSFKVSLTPSVSQVGSSVALTETVFLTARDAFTNAILRSQRNQHTTQLLNDISNVGGDGKVVQ
ncbi:MAG: hypothetical protein K9M36_02355 [Candidatus Pacebacteria bacterium]|nr:hypothetical protein [Candidatus Paceibacterota bacterium]